MPSCEREIATYTNIQATTFPFTIYQACCICLLHLDESKYTTGKSEGVLVHKKGSGLVCNFWHYWCCWHEYVGIYCRAANVLARYLNCHTFASWADCFLVNECWVQQTRYLTLYKAPMQSLYQLHNYVFICFYSIYVCICTISLLLLILILSLVSLRGCWLSNVQDRHPAIVSARRGPPRRIVLCWRGMALRLGVKRRKYGRLSAIFQHFPTGIREAQTNQCKNEPNCLESLESEFSINNHDTWVH